MAATLEIIWDKLEHYIIRDVYEKFHEKVQKFMLENYFIPHRLYAQLKFEEDPEVNKQYLKYVEHILRDQCSIVVVDTENTDRIYAVALVKCMTKEWKSWTSFKICIDECKFTDIIELQYRMITEQGAAAHDDFDTLHIFEYYIDNDLRQDYGFISKFFNAIYETARHFKMPRVTFLALGQTEQQECFDQGYDPVARAIFSIYTIKNRRPFALLREIDEMEAILFEVDIDALVPFNEIIVRGIDDVEQPKPQMKKPSVGTVSLPKRSASIVV